MANALKCPNPSCPFLFDPTQVPPGAVLTCPRCTMRFTLGGSAPQTSDPGLDFSSKPAARQSEAGQREIKPSFIQTRGMLFVGIGACVAVVIAIGVLLLSGSGGNRPAPAANNDKIFRDINFAVNVPEGWEKDEDVRNFAKANVLGMKKIDSSARIAIAFAGIKTRNPQPGELRDGLIAERLDAMFDDLDARPGDGAWLGSKAMQVNFRGRGVKLEGNYTGEAYGVGLHGNAYWFLAWASEADFARVSDEFDKIRTSCRLLNPEVSWKPTEAGISTFTGQTAGYRLVDGDQWWEKGDPSNEDVKADLLLKAKYKTRAKMDRPPEALAVVYLLPAGEDPLGATRKYVQDRYIKLFDIKRWNEVTGDTQGDPPAAGISEKADAVRYHAQSDQGVSKLVVLHAISTPQGIVGIEASCPWNERSKWEKRLIALASSLQVK